MGNGGGGTRPEDRGGAWHGMDQGMMESGELGDA